MKTKLILFGALVLIGFKSTGQQYDTLTNKTIVSLTKIGLPPATIINKIQTSITSFDVSVKALMDLQTNGVNGDVINEMMKINEKSNVAASKEANSGNPNEMHKPGIYYFNPNDTNNNTLKKVDPSVTSTIKSGGFGTALAQRMSYGIAKNNLVSTVSGSASHLKIKGSAPEFYFYFDNNSNPQGDSWFFSTATSPNEFVIVKLKEKKDSREMTVGDANAYGSSSGVPEKMKVPFDYQQVSEGIYKVTFSKPLKEGEYCFLYASTTPSRFNNNKVFDYGIYSEK